MATGAARRGRPKITAPKKHGPEFSAESTWAALSKNIYEILNHRASNLSFEENHRYAYNMVLYKHGDKLYKGVKQSVVENLEKLAKEKVEPTFPTTSGDESVLSAEEELLLKALRTVWDEHTSSMSRLGQVLRYMDRVHTQQTNDPTTAALALELFIKHIMRDGIKEHVIDAILHQIQHEREGFSINRSAVKACVDVFLSLSIDHAGTTLYKHDLEPRFLEESREFYKKEGARLSTKCDASTYLVDTEARFHAEDERVHHYLSSQTSLALIQILKDELLTPHIASVIAAESGLELMIDNNKSADLQRLFRLCSMVPSGIKALRDRLKASIIRRGTFINENSLSENGNVAEGDDQDGQSSVKKDSGKGKARTPALSLQNAVNWVQEVLNLKDKFDAVWKRDFQNHRDLETGLIEAFESFVNMNKKAPEFISLFIDDHLKRGFKGKSDDEVDSILSNTISIFRYITEKDVFERYYKGHLSKRLLQGKSVNDDAEQNMLIKFKVECGIQFTRKMEGMFRDIKLSEDISRDYHEYLSKTTAPELDLSVIVMTYNCWPMSHSDSPCNLPPIMAKACESFTQFYLNKHSGRRLTWQYSLGNAEVKTKFNAKTHELNVSTFALVILLLFQDLGDDEFLTYSEIKESTGINDSDLKRHLQSLACAKFKILSKHPPGREINPSDSFSFNSKFTAPMHKIKIGTISSKVESPEEAKETRERIDEERNYQIDACVVRIMKSRKKFGHNELIQEVTVQLHTKFSPNPSDIKRRIESLIEREYLDRAEDRKSYIYLA